ncbi:lysozyme inhibitor LprI family protein [Lysobacter cavernae]|uniref:Lysozyme inhibitor LprI family protein n=1 Tax=Lysobacter cavernae TaxID=1685901 RepID=A0ABV7RUJ5_9GAMM
MKVFPALLLLCPLLAPAAAEAAGFDCTKAVSWAERAICFEPALGRLDEQLGQRYEQALAASDSPDLLRTEQNRWLHDRRDACTSAGCLQSAYRERLRQLDRAIASAPPALVAPGTYRRESTGAAAELTVAALGSGRYSLRGQARPGAAPLTGEIAPRVGAADFVAGNCRLKLMFAPDLINVSGSGTGCGGPSAGLDGDYRRVTK